MAVAVPTPELLEQYNREGFLVLPDLLSPGEVATLQAGLERVFATPSPEAALYTMPDMWRPKMFEHGEEFEAMVDHPGIIDFCETVLGKDCHMIAETGLKTTPGRTFTAWHVDDAVRLPLPEGVKLDPRIPMPTYLINMNYYLCDVDEELGPTQFVPGSHRAGRSPMPEDNDANGNPVFEGRSMVSTPGKAGTLVLWNDQTWHQGGPNRSKGRTRWVLQTPMARRWVSLRYYPGVNYQIPEAIVARANPRRKRLLGFHPPGAYG